MNSKLQEMNIQSTPLGEINFSIRHGLLHKALDILARHKCSIPQLLHEQKVNEIGRLLRNSKKSDTIVDVFIYVQHTAGYQSNSGIQRVARQLIKHLLLIPSLRIQCIAIDYTASAIRNVSREEAFNLSEWNGPSLQDLQIAHTSFSPGIVIIPELVYTSFYPISSSMEVIDFFKKQNLSIISIFYDNIPFVIPAYKSIAAIHADYVDAILASDCIVPISNWVARDLLDYSIHVLSLSELAVRSKIHPLLLGSTHMEQDISSDNFGKTCLPANGYMLSVGTITPHKNQLQLITAYRLYRCQNPKSKLRLVLAGNIASELIDFVIAQQSDDIVVIRTPSDNLLYDLYSNCKMVCFPSGEEGFGLPIIEAIGHGKPVIAANFGAMAEVSESIGIGCLAVNTFNTVELAQAMARLDEDPTALGSKHEIQSKSNIITWSQYAIQFTGLISKLLLPHDANKIIFNASCLSRQCATNSNLSIIHAGILKGLIDLGHCGSIVLVKGSNDPDFLIQLASHELECINSTLGCSIGLADFTFSKPIGYQGSIYVDPSTNVLIDSGFSFEKAASIIAFFKENEVKTCGFFFEPTSPRSRKSESSLLPVNCDYLKILSLYDYVFPVSYEAENNLRDYWSLIGADASAASASVRTVVPAAEDLNMAKRSSFNLQPSRQLADTPFKEWDELVRGKLVFCFFSIAEPDLVMNTVVQAFRSLPFRLKSRAALFLVGKRLEAEDSSKICSLADNQSIFFVDQVDDQGIEYALSRSSVSIFSSIGDDFGMAVSKCLQRGIPVMMPYCDAENQVWRQDAGFYLMAGSRLCDLRDAIALMIDAPAIVERLKIQATNYSPVRWSEYVNSFLSGVNSLAFSSINHFSEEVRDVKSFNRRNVNLHC